MRLNRARVATTFLCFLKYIVLIGWDPSWWSSGRGNSGGGRGGEGGAGKYFLATTTSKDRRFVVRFCLWVDGWM